MDYVNSESTKQVPVESMIQLLPCVKRVIANLKDNYNPNKSFSFDNIDIKDGFFCLQVNEKYACNLGYMLLSFATTK